MNGLSEYFNDLYNTFIQMDLNKMFVGLLITNFLLLAIILYVRLFCVAGEMCELIKRIIEMIKLKRAKKYDNTKETDK